MKNATKIALLLAALVSVVGCSDGGSSVITPDQDFYERAAEAKANGQPPGAPPQAGKIQPAQPKPAA
ncbi:hypothetical protein [Rhodopirellula sp. MGV]|uniref:hypothetical protein n=1 Tax=Rhodopirellula sp. MGV TaxID=2023130 RepID=UPI000BC70B16|nr:hypothetical protein [Rhodopirellula sp. MGV]OYP35820.1 hypothetical protein CGZ80_10505 [Rhodopirellula sp. MGV]